MRRLFASVRRGLLVATALQSCAAFAAADKAPAMADHAATSARDEGGITEIVVTARKRTERLQDAPIAISAITQVELQRRGVTSLENLSASTPQLDISRTPGAQGAVLRIRGVGSTATNTVGAEQSVAVVIDGTYYSQARIIEEGFLDLERIEVLEGPQALFFGKNATAGVISMTTADPGGHPEFLGRASYGIEGKDAILEGVASGPLTDTLGLRVAVQAERMFGGYFRNAATVANGNFLNARTFEVVPTQAAPADRDLPGTRKITGRGTLKWEITPDVTSTLKVSGTLSRDGTPSANSVPICPGPNFQLNPGIACPSGKRIIYNNRFPSELNWPGSGDGNLTNTYNSYAINDLLKASLGNYYTLSSITNYNAYNAHALYDCAPEDTTLCFSREFSSASTFSNETRLLTNFDGPFNFLGGIYYQSTKQKFHSLFNFSFQLTPGVEVMPFDPQAPNGYQYVGGEKISTTRGRTISPYYQAIWKIVPELELDAGVRYTHETKDTRFRNGYVNLLFAGTFTPGLQVRSKQAFNNWSPDINLSWKPAKDVLVYAAYKTGFKSGGFSATGIINEADPTGKNVTFQPERVKGFEGGVKATLLDKQVRLNVIGYRYNYKDLQIDYYNPVTVAQITTNAAGARSTGVETWLEFAPRAAPGLLLSAYGNYNKSVFTRFIAPCYTGQTIEGGCNLLDPNGSGAPFQNRSGFSTPNAPRWSGSVAISYDRDLNSAMKGGVSLNGRYSGKYLVSAYGSPFLVQRSFIVLDASIRLARQDDRWELAVIGRNLTNRFYLKGGELETTGTGSGTGTAAGIPSDYVAQASDPRTVMLQLSVRY